MRRLRTGGCCRSCFQSKGDRVGRVLPPRPRCKPCGQRVTVGKGEGLSGWFPYGKQGEESKTRFKRLGLLSTLVELMGASCDVLPCHVIWCSHVEHLVQSSVARIGARCFMRLNYSRIVRDLSPNATESSVLSSKACFDVDSVSWYRCV